MLTSGALNDGALFNCFERASAAQVGRAGLSITVNWSASERRGRTPPSGTGCGEGAVPPQERSATATGHTNKWKRAFMESLSGEGPAFSTACWQ